jgi:PEP-CTERM motif
MKILRFLAMAALLIAGNGIAKAYVIGVLDPLSGPGFAVVVPGETFPLTFVNDCKLFDINAQGCFFGFNASDEPLTTLNLTIPGIQGQTADCQTVGTLFGDANCSETDDVYTLDFFGGQGIGACTYFIIYENGVSANDFPAGTAVADPTPEPSSIWLTLSGTGALGYFVRRRRRFLS